MAVVHEQIIPFSGSREAAEIIRKNAPPNIPVIGDIDYAVEPVAGYLDRPIFVACRGEYTRYLKLDKKRLNGALPREALAKAIQDLMAAEKSDVVLIVNYPLSLSGDGIEELGVVTRSIVPDEKYLIFRIKYRGS